MPIWFDDDSFFPRTVTQSMAMAMANANGNADNANANAGNDNGTASPKHWFASATTLAHGQFKRGLPGSLVYYLNTGIYGCACMMYYCMYSYLYSMYSALSLQLMTMYMYVYFCMVANNYSNECLLVI